MGERYRITTLDDGRYLPEVRSCLPWVWRPVNKEGWMVERCDYLGEETYEAALENCRTCENKARHVPRVRYFDFDQTA